MRRTMLLVALSSAFTMLVHAESYSGKLLDAACYDQMKQANACAASGNTTAFALEASGTVYKLDRGGNSKAAAAIKNRADRVDPSKQQSKGEAKEVMAKVEGAEKSGTITVESIEVQ